MRPFLACGLMRCGILAGVLCGIVAVAQVGHAGTIGYWRLEGDYTTTVNPVLNGTAGGAPVFGSDVPGTTILDGLGGPALGTDTQSVAFNGANYVSIPYNALVEPASFTIEFFMKAPAQGAYPGIVTKSNFVTPGRPTSWGIGKQNQEYTFIRIDTDAANNQTAQGGAPTGDNRWHHFALTHDAATGMFRLYRDYAQVAPMDPPGNLIYDGQTGLRFGLMQAGGSFQPYIGTLDDVRFSDAVLTPSQFLAVASMTLQWGAGGAGGTGTWDAMTTANWYPGSLPNVPWSTPVTTSPNEAIFAGTAGTVTVDAGGVTAKSVTFNTPGYTLGGPGKLTLAGPNVVANQNATISAAIAAPAGLTKSGGARLTLGGPNVNYTGPTTVSAGTLELADTNNFASPITLGGGNLELGGSTNWGLSAPISGAGTVTKTGANQVTLYNTSSYDGQTVVSQGTLRLGAGAVPTAGLAAWYDAGAGVTTSGGNVTAWADRTGQHNATAVGTPALVAGDINGLPAVQVTTGGWLSAAGAFQAKSVYTVFKSPTAAFTYYGSPFGAVNYSPPPTPPGNTDGGRTFIFWNGQTKFWQDPGVPGVRKNGTALLGGPNYDMAPIDQYMLLGVDTANANNVRSYYIGRSDGYTASLNIAEILAYDHVLTAAEENLLGAYLAQKYGIGTTYVGQAQNSIPDSSTVAIAGGATFDLNGASETIGALADYGGGGGTVTNNAAGRPSVLTLAASSGTNTFGGTIQNGASPISLVKSGAGTQILSGANTYGGTTAVAAGTLQLTGGTNRLPSTTVLTLGDAVGNTSGKLILGDASGAVSQTLAGLANAGTGAQSIIGGSGSISTLTINNASPFTYTGAIGGAGTNENNLALAKTGAGTLTIGGPLSYAGPTTITEGTLTFSGAPLIHYTFDSIPGNTATNLGNGGSALDGEARGATVVPGAVGNALSFTGVAGNSGVVTKNNASMGNAYTLAAWVFTNGTGGVQRIIENSYARSAYLGSDEGGLGYYRYLTIVQGSYDRGGNINAGYGVWHHVAEVWDGAKVYLYVDGSLVAGYPYPHAADSTWSGNKFGFASNPGFGENWTGSLDDPYVFTRALSPAEVQTLYLGGSLAVGALPATTALQIGPSGTLDLYGTSQTVGSLSDFGGGGGRITTSATGGLAFLTVAPASGGTAFTGTIENGAGTIGLVKSGAGAQTLSGPNITYTGTTTVSGGTLRLSDTGNFASPIVLGGGNLELSGSSNWTVSRPITGSGAVSKTGSGQVTLTAGSTYGGDTTVTEGALKLDGVGGFGSNVNNSATVELYSGVGGNWGLAAGRTIAGDGLYLKTGPGRVYLPNVVVTASGQIRVQQGTLSNEWNSANWSGSTVSLDVSPGAVFDMRADSVKVNVLTGSGSITNTYSGSGTDILTVASGNFAGPIGGSGDGFSGEGQGRTGLTKVSPGTLMLGGASTYAGPTSVTAGTLLVDGSIASPVTVTGGTLGGGGSIAGNVDIQTGGSISAGDSPGHLTIDGQYSQTGHMLVEISGLDRGLDPGYDWIQVTGGHGAAVDGPVDIQLLGGFMPASGDAFDVLTAADIQVGPGFSLNGPPLLPAQYWDYRIVDPWPGPGGGMALEVFVGVPEPASLLLAMVGLAGFLACAGSCRRKWKSH